MWEGGERGETMNETGLIGAEMVTRRREGEGDRRGFIRGMGCRLNSCVEMRQ